MSDRDETNLSRRGFLGRSVALAAVVPFVPELFARGAVAAPASPYRSLTTSEATFTEALVNLLCPADHLTPDGVTCGLATYIDRRLAGEFGAEASSQLPLSKAQLFRQGVAAIDDASRRQFGVPFAQLNASAAGPLLAAVTSGRLTHGDISLVPWHKEVVDPLLVEAAFSGEIYEKYANNVFAKLY